MRSFIVTEKVFRYPGAGGWYFVYVNAKVSEQIKKDKTAKKVGFSFVKIKAKVGTTEWDTSLFPTKEGPYLLSIKANVRKKEGIMEGDVIRVQCKIL